MKAGWIILFLTVSVAAFSGFGKAGAPPIPPAHTAPACSPLNALDLTDPQKAQIEAILEESREKMDSLRGDREKMKAFFEGQKVKLDAILTPAQKAKLDGLRKQWKADRPLQVITAFAGALNLTNGQVSKIFHYYTTYRETVWVFRFVLTGGLPKPA